MMAAQQYGRHLAAVPLLRPGVLGILQKAVPMAFLGVATLLRQHTGHHTAQAVRHRHGGDLAAGQHEIAQRQFLVHALLQEPLVHALIVAANQDQVVVLLLQLAGHLLVEGAAAG